MSDEQVTYRGLLQRVKSFQRDLPEDHEAGIATTTSGGPFYLAEMSLLPGGIVAFKGEAQDGSLIESAMHVSQVSLTLTALLKDGGRRRSMGFRGDL
jgi:hypothetical protein